MHRVVGANEPSRVAARKRLHIGRCSGGSKGAGPREGAGIRKEKGVSISHERFVWKESKREREREPGAYGSFS